MVGRIAGRWVRSGFHSDINGVVKSYGFYTLGYKPAGCFLSKKGIIHILHGFLQDRIPIVGVGGILCAEDAKKKFNAGANLIQVYTGLVFSGPGLLKEIREKLT